MQKVQKIKFVYCPHCNVGQYQISKYNEELREVKCSSCGFVFDIAKEENIST